MKPVIGITIGDVAGIGPEIIKKTLSVKKIHRKCLPVVIGDANDIKVRSGRISKKAGKYAMQCVERAVEMAMQGQLDAIVTAPITKEGIHRAGYDFEGHTDFLAHLTGTKKYSMMFAGKKIRVILVTIHLKIKDVAKRIKVESVKRAIEHADLGAKLLGIKKPRIAVCALNPHGAEIGEEEEKVIIPAIKKTGLKYVKGPFPADSLFYKALQKEFDIVVAMYHDQGLIPLKMMDFMNGVNVTLGLPFIRTSPDHGTAYDIAGKGVADPQSMIRAVELATEMSQRG